MQIGYLRIKNFRSLRDVELQNLGNLNIFVGKNSSGKSNLLEALSIFFNHFSVIGGSIAGLNEYYWFDKKTKNPIEYHVEIELSNSELSQIFTPELLGKINRARIPRLLNKIIIKRIIRNIQGAWETLDLKFLGISLVKNDKSLGADAFGKSLFQKQTKTKKIPISVTAEQLNVILAGISNTIKGKFRLIAQIRDVKNPIAHRVALIDSELQNSLWTLDQSIKSGEEEKCVEIETSFTNITGKRLDPAQGQVYIRRQRRRFPLNLEGGGIQATIQLIFILKNEMEKYSVFGIEEPEAHTHPELQRKLFNELKSVSENCQLFIATHSPVFTDRMDLKKVWISKFANGETTFERTNELSEIVEELGIKPSDFLFFADKILFVEGKCEEIVIPAFAEKLGISLKDVAIISVEGKNKARLNLKTWVKITRGMLPLYLLLDKDAEAEIKELVKENLAEPGKYHLWNRGSIESYYPPPLLRKALNEIDQRYSLEMDVNTIMKQIENGQLLPHKIDLGEKQGLLGKKWKVLLAENVARLIRKEEELEIHEEVQAWLRKAIEF